MYDDEDDKKNSGEWIQWSAYKKPCIQRLERVLGNLYGEHYGDKSLSKSKDSIRSVAQSLTRMHRYPAVSHINFHMHPRGFTKRAAVLNGSEYKSGVGRIGVLNTLSLLEVLNYVVICKGGNFNKEGVREWSNFRLTPEGFMFIEGALKGMIPEYLPLKSSVIELSKSVGGNRVLLNFSQTKEILDMMSTATRYNEAMGSHVFRNNKGEEFPVHIVRKFCNDSFEHGGRFYYTGYSVQYMPQVDREGVTIDGEETSELDFKGVHLALLDLINGFIWEDDYDPYATDEDWCTVDWGQLEQFKLHNNKPNYDPIRAFAKKALLVAINCKSRDVAEYVLHEEYMSDSLDSDEEINYYGIINVRVSDLLDEVMNRNAHCAKHFFTGIGTRLQKLDSDIAEVILDKCISKGIPVLCIHDSFIVKSSDKQDLREIMEGSWGEVLGFMSNCFIEEK